MIPTRWNTGGSSIDAERRAMRGPAILAIVVIVALQFIPFSRLFAAPWVMMRSDVLGWWPVGGLWRWIGVAALGVAILTPVWCYSIGKSYRTILTAGAVTLAIALALLFWGGRSRVEVRAHDIRVTSDRWGEADAIYRADDAADMSVNCTTGQKGEPYPSLSVRFRDGRVLELEALTSRVANPGATRAGLDFAEGLDTVLIDRGDRVAGSIQDSCVEQMERRLTPADAPRIGALFGPAITTDPSVVVPAPAQQ